MLARIVAIALNTYREAVRARVLYGVFGVALATTAYSLRRRHALAPQRGARRRRPRRGVDLALRRPRRDRPRLHVALPTSSSTRRSSPFSTRRLRRREYVVGKYLGAMLTLGVFVAVDGGRSSASSRSRGTRQRRRAGRRGGGAPRAILGVLLCGRRATRVYVLLPWSLRALRDDGPSLRAGPDERRLVIASAVLTVSEVGDRAAVATLFASFSSPFLTAIFTLVRLRHRALGDTLAHLPPKIFGAELHASAQGSRASCPTCTSTCRRARSSSARSPDEPVWPYVATGGDPRRLLRDVPPHAERARLPQARLP